MLSHISMAISLATTIELNRHEFCPIIGQRNFSARAISGRKRATLLGTFKLCVNDEREWVVKHRE